MFFKGSDNMTKEFVTHYIDKKIYQDENYIRYTFYELRVKNNLSEEEANEFLRISNNYFENKGYKVYFTGDKYEYNDAKRTVQSNELMVAIRDRKG